MTADEKLLPRPPGTLLVYLDGADGSGKTTQTDLLFRRLTESHTDVKLAPRLGEFLDCGDDGRSFRQWVTSTAPEIVNEAMLQASNDRVTRELNTGRDCIVLLDRGPLTVYASCVARLMQRRGLDEQSARIRLSAQFQLSSMYPPWDHAASLSVLLQRNSIRDESIAYAESHDLDSRNDYLLYLVHLDRAIDLCSRDISPLVRINTEREIQQTTQAIFTSVRKAWPPFEHTMAD